VPLDYVVLRPSETVCEARAASRTEGVIADYGPYREPEGGEIPRFMMLPAMAATRTVD